MKLKVKDVLNIIGKSDLLEKFDNQFLNLDILGSDTDSRLIAENYIFIPVIGDSVDGHNFLDSAFENGAVLAIVKHIPDKFQNSDFVDKCIVVDDNLSAYHKIAKFCVDKFNGKKVALTGSAGKTTVKNWLFKVLSLYGLTFATDGNKNSEYGLPWTILKNYLSDDWDKYQYGVFEMSMSKPGDISLLCDIVRPKIGLVNNVYPMHLEFFPETGISGIAKTKAEIFKNVDVAIYNADTNKSDVLLDAIVGDFINFGRNAQVIKLVDIVDNKIFVNINGKKFDYQLACGPSEFAVLNSLAVLSVIYSLGLDLQTAVDYMHNLNLEKGRGAKLNLHHNGKNLVVFDHSYSGQPDSVLCAIDDFLVNCKNYSDNRKVFIFGGMSEIGDDSVNQHLRVFDRIKSSDIDFVIGVKGDAKVVVDELLKIGRKSVFFENIDAFLSVFDDFILDNDVLLIKGSHYGSQVFRIVDMLSK